MASTYSTNLALELIGTGEQSGTWGTTTNTNLGTLLEQAISGYVTQAITDGSGANTTITIPNGTTGVARNMFIEMTGALSFSTTSLIVPANKKMYFIFNNTSGGFAVTVKVSGQTGILVPNGKKVILTCNGTDIVEAHTAIVGNATIGGTLGVTGVSTLTAGAIVQGLTVGLGAGAVSSNTAVGASALAANTSGANSVAVGASALSGQTTGGFNTAVGQNSMSAIVTGSSNTTVGVNSMAGNTSGANNAALGGAALFTNNSGSNNTAIGSGSLQNNTTASNNTAVGYQAGYTNTTGTRNTFIGEGAGYSTTSSFNTFIGNHAGQSTTGGYNTFIGDYTGYLVTTGAKNVIIGKYDGSAAPISATGSNYIVLSDGDGNVRGTFDSSGTLLVGCTGGGGSGNAIVTYGSGGDIQRIFSTQASSGSFTLISMYSGATTPSSPTGTLRVNITTNGGIANFQANNTNLSDRREKTNFAPATSYLDKICAIPVQTFNYIDQNMEEDDGLTLGVVAQDVQAVAPELVMESNWASKDDEPKMRLSIYQTDLQYALMKCIQEQQAIITALTTRITALEAK